MPRKGANDLKKGNYFVPDGFDEPFLVQTNQHSKSGKHGSAKQRVGCTGLFTGKRKSISLKAKDTVIVPEILKKTGQLVDIDGTKKMCQVMDLESYETVDVEFPVDEEEVKIFGKLQKVIDDPSLINDTMIDFWDVMSKKFVTRVILPE